MAHTLPSILGGVLGAPKTQDQKEQSSPPIDNCLHSCPRRVIGGTHPLRRARRAAKRLGKTELPSPLGTAAAAKNIPFISD
jgi:hypothetical protein